MEHQPNSNNRTVSMRIADQIIIEIPDAQQINVIREEPGNDMSGRINNLINAFILVHAAILTSVFSLQGPIGAKIRGSVVLLSGAVSVLKYFSDRYLFRKYFSNRS